MLNPFAYIWRSEAVQLPPAPLTTDGLNLLQADTRRTRLYLGEYPVCIGVVSRDYLSLRLAKMPAATFPPRLEARATGTSVVWHAVFRRSLGGRIWLTLWFAAIIVAAGLLGIIAIREFPTSAWLRFAMSSVALIFLWLLLTASLQRECRTWQWQRKQLEAFVSRGFTDVGAV